MRRLLICAALVAGCGSNENTYVLLQIERGDLVGDVTSIALDFSMPGKHATATLDEGGGAISLPTSASYQLEGGGGQLTVMATAMNGTTTLESGSTTMQIPSGKTTSMTVTFGAVVGPMNDLGPNVDLETLDLRGPSGDMAQPPHMLAVNVTLVAGASGVLLGFPSPSPQPAINCGSACNGNYSYGSTVVLIPSPAAGFYFGGWSGDCTGLGPTCALQMTADHHVGAAFSPPNHAFVTASPSPIPAIIARGSGATMADQFISGADAICQSEAAMAGRSGQFAAWVSSDTVNARDHLQAKSPTSVLPAGWLRFDGKPFLDQIASPFVADRVQHVYYPLAVTVNGQIPSWMNPAVFTNTSIGGTTTLMSCSGFTDVSPGMFVGGGRFMGGDEYWTNTDAWSCASSGRLYCFEVDYTAALVSPFPAAQYKWAFVTKGTFDPSTGLVAADTLCDNEAIAANLVTSMGHFSALLAPVGNNPASRFSLGGTLPYMRTDNVIVVAADSDLFVPQPSPFAPIERAADGSLAATQAYLGAMNPGSVADANCNGWTSNSTGDNVEVLNPSANSYSGIQQNCSIPASLICLQK